jgi:rhamnosyltransferase subunit B
VPQLVVPFGNDQPDNAARLRDLGVALTLSSWSASKGRMRHRLQRLLQDSSFKRAAAQLSGRLVLKDGAQAVSELLTHT